MRSSTSIYYIEVREEDTNKRVPHAKGTKYTDFLSRRSAVKFLNDLVENNPENTFRLCKRTQTETSEEWKNGRIKLALSGKLKLKIKISK